MKPIKIHIKKIRPMGVNWMHYYLVEKLLLDDYSPIKTEAQLMGYIYSKYGAGRYQLLAWTKGREGFWLFWLGDCYENGFMRDKSRNVELEKLQKAHARATSYEERQDIENNMQFERDVNDIDKKLKRRGPYGIIKSKSGVLHAYEDVY